MCKQMLPCPYVRDASKVPALTKESEEDEERFLTSVVRRIRGSESGRKSQPAAFGPEKASGMQTQMTARGVSLETTPIGRLAFPDESGGFLEFDFGGVAEGVEDAEKEIGD